MIKIHEPMSENISLPKSFNLYFSGKSFAVFDIETTGLYPVHDSIILTGAVVVRDGKAELLQFFAETPTDERELIENTISLISSLDFAVTFNGRLFDIPFIKKRAAKYGLEFPSVYDFDLYNLMRYYSALPEFTESMSQKSLEKYAGISHLRNDKISGSDSITAYRNYLDRGSENLRSIVLLHNSDDVKQLYRLLELVKISELHRSLYKTGFPAGTALIENISIKSLQLIVKGTCPGIKDYISFPMPDAPFTLRQSSTDSSFEVTIDCEKKYDAIYTDAKAVSYEIADELSKYPAFVDGYLILKEKDKINYPEINIFLLKTIPKILHVDTDSKGENDLNEHA